MKLNTTQFVELSTDIFDEIQRRLKKRFLNNTFLPPEEEYHPKRNSAREKLASMSSNRFLELVVDIMKEWERRYVNETSVMLKSLLDERSSRPKESLLIEKPQSILEISETFGIENEYSDLEKMVSELQLAQSPNTRFSSTEFNISSNQPVTASLEELLYMDITEATIRIKDQQRTLQDQSTFIADLKSKYDNLYNDYQDLHGKHTHTQSNVLDLSGKVEHLTQSQQNLLFENKKEKEKLSKLYIEKENLELTLKDIQFQVDQAKKNAFYVPRISDISGAETAIGTIKRFHFLNDYFLVTDALIYAARSNSAPDLMTGIKTLLSRVRLIMEATETLENENQTIFPEPPEASPSSKSSSIDDHDIVSKSRLLRSKISQLLMNFIAAAKKVAIEKRDIKELKALESLVQELNVLIVRLSHVRVQLFLNLVDFTQSPGTQTAPLNIYLQNLISSSSENAIRLSQPPISTNGTSTPLFKESGFIRNNVFDTSILGNKTDQIIGAIEILLQDTKSSISFDKLALNMKQVTIYSKDFIESGRIALYQPEFTKKRGFGDKMLQQIEQVIERLESFQKDHSDEKKKLDQLKKNESNKFQIEEIEKNLRQIIADQCHKLITAAREVLSIFG